MIPHATVKCLENFVSAHKATEREDTTTVEKYCARSAKSVSSPSRISVFFFCLVRRMMLENLPGSNLYEHES